MNEIYIVDGQEYEVAPNRKEEFLVKFPTAQLLQEPGKTTPTVPGAAVEKTAVPDQPNMELDSVDTSLELEEPSALKSTAARSASALLGYIKGAKSYVENVGFKTLRAFLPDMRAKEKKGKKNWKKNNKKRRL